MNPVGRASDLGRGAGTVASGRTRHVLDENARGCVASAKFPQTDTQTHRVANNMSVDSRYYIPIEYKYEIKIIFIIILIMIMKLKCIYA